MFSSETIKNIVRVGETFLILGMLGSVMRGEANANGRLLTDQANSKSSSNHSFDIGGDLDDLNDLVAIGQACNTGEGYVVCSEVEKCVEELEPIDFGEIVEIPDGVPTEYVSYVCKPK
jgi:hypothetical protein